MLRTAMLLLLARRVCGGCAPPPAPEPPLDFSASSGVLSRPAREHAAFSAWLAALSRSARSHDPRARGLADRRARPLGVVPQAARRRPRPLGEGAAAAASSLTTRSWICPSSSNICARRSTHHASRDRVDARLRATTPGVHGHLSAASACPGAPRPSSLVDARFRVRGRGDHCSRGGAADEREHRVHESAIADCPARACATAVASPPNHEKVYRAARRR